MCSLLTCASSLNFSISSSATCKSKVIWKIASNKQAYEQHLEKYYIGKKAMQWKQVATYEHLILKHWKEQTEIVR